MPRISKQEQEEAIARLRQWIKPGDTIYCVLRHVSQSGMGRTIALYRQDHETHRMGWITYLAHKALAMPFDAKREGIKIGGCGMDMGFELVYNLGRVLFPDGFALPEGAYGRNGDTSGYDKDGGYALKHQWL